jgi:hypothetical protein
MIKIAAHYDEKDTVKIHPAKILSFSNSRLCGDDAKRGILLSYNPKSRHNLINLLEDFFVSHLRR